MCDPLAHSVCLSVHLCMCYSRQRRCARKGGCPASPLVTIEGGQGPTLGPPGRLSTCLMGSEGVLALAVRVVILLRVSAPWIGEMGEINESQHRKTACKKMSVSMLKNNDHLGIHVAIPQITHLIFPLCSIQKRLFINISFRIQCTNLSLISLIKSSTNLYIPLQEKKIKVFVFTGTVTYRLVCQFIRNIMLILRRTHLCLSSLWHGFEFHVNMIAKIDRNLSAAPCMLLVSHITTSQRCSVGFRYGTLGPWSHALETKF